MTNIVQSPEPFQAVGWRHDHVRLLDQRLLPQKEHYIDYHKAPALAEAITGMIVRGAPAIGITAAYAVVLAARDAWRHAGPEWKHHIEKDLHCLLHSRPTAVNLQWALDRMRRRIAELHTDPEPPLLDLALAIHQQDIDANRAMGRLGAALIDKPCSVITHCNAGALATGGYGTALGVIRTLHQQQKLEQVYVSETRPWMQGARLTAWELQREQIPITLMIDSAAASLMRTQQAAWFIAGADRIAANGDVINKIGTYMHALAARHHKICTMIIAPSSTIDMSIQSGQQAPIENRPPEEITGPHPPGGPIHAINPVFDLTPAALVDYLVTEKGVIPAPDPAKMQAAFG